MNVLGLDLGRTTGVALAVDGVVLSWDEYKLRGERQGRLVWFHHWLAKLVDDATSPIDLIAFEKVQFVRSRAQITLLAQLEAMLVLVCAGREIRVLPVPVGTLKKWWTGDGRADKSEMIEVARSRVLEPESSITDNEADAIALAYFGAEHFNRGEIP